MSATSKVILSNGFEYELPTNAVSTASDSLAVTFLPVDGETIDDVESHWTGNSLIKVVCGDTVIRNFEGYTKVSSVLKKNDYQISKTVVDEEGQETIETETITVYIVTVEKPALEGRVSNNEDAIDDILSIIL